MNLEKWNKASEYHTEFESMKWIKEIPSINFPSEWGVKIIPPFGGAVIRFQVRYKEAFVSVYLDCYDLLGVFGEPYWEAYPCDGDTYRCRMNDVNKLLKAITESIKEQNNG